MSEAPERLWIDPDILPSEWHKRYHCDVEYVRADRIKELEAKLVICEKYRDAYAECDRIGTQAVRDLEAKLAKVIAIVRSHDTGDMQREDMEVRRILQKIEAELKGGKANDL